MLDKTRTYTSRTCPIGVTLEEHTRDVRIMDGSMETIVRLTPAAAEDLARSLLFWASESRGELHR